MSAPTPIQDDRYSEMDHRIHDFIGICNAIKIGPKDCAIAGGKWPDYDRWSGIPGTVVILEIPPKLILNWHQISCQYFLNCNLMNGRDFTRSELKMSFAEIPHITAASGPLRDIDDCGHLENLVTESSATNFFILIYRPGVCNGKGILHIAGDSPEHMCISYHSFLQI